MKNLQITEEAIKELHRVGGKKVKSQLVIQFPELFIPPITELQVGVWYRHSGGILFCHQEGQKVYGFDSDGSWCDASKICWSWKKTLVEGLTLATKEEVVKAYRVEARRRGYTIDSFNSLEKGSQAFNPNYDCWTFIDFSLGKSVLYTQSQGKGGRAVCVDGVWAKQKDMKRIAQVKQEIADLTLELEQIDKYYI